MLKKRIIDNEIVYDFLFREDLDEIVKSLSCVFSIEILNKIIGPGTVLWELLIENLNFSLVSNTWGSFLKPLSANATALIESRMSEIKLVGAKSLAQSLEEIELDVWPSPPEDASFLLKRCHLLRKKRLKDFDTEDLRIMIGQKIGLAHLMPLAITILNENPFAEGDYYEGDLLEKVLGCGDIFWKDHATLSLQMKSILSSALSMMNSIDLSHKLKELVLIAAKQFGL